MTQYGAVDRRRRRRRTRSSRPGFPIGKRFKSVEVVRVCDGNVVHLGHHAKADGRWRVYAFADAPARASHRALTAWAEWMSSPDSPIARHTPAGADVDAVFDVKAIYQQPHSRTSTSRGFPSSSCPGPGRWG